MEEVNEEQGKKIESIYKSLEKCCEDEEKNRERIDEGSKVSEELENRIVLLEKTLEFTHVTKPQTDWEEYYVKAREMTE